MNTKLLAILVVALFVLPSVPVAYSADTSVSSLGNIIQTQNKETHVQNIVDEINKDFETTNPGYTATVDPQNPDEIHIEGPGTGGNTVNKPGPVDISMTLPANTKLIISVTLGISLISAYNFTMSYVDPVYGSVTCQGKVESGIFATQYYYPDPVNKTVVKVPSGADYHTYGFVSMNEVTFKLDGEAASRLSGLNLKIVIL